MDNGNSKVEHGSGNVFTDLGHPDPDPETHLLKAELVTRIDDIIRGRGLKQVEAAKLPGLSQPDVSRLLRGNFRPFGRTPATTPDNFGARRSDQHPEVTIIGDGHAHHRRGRGSMRI